MNKEIIETIKNVKTADELKDVASKNGYNLTLEEAKGYFDLYHNNGKVNEEELDNVTGGSSCIGGKSYSDDPHGYLIITAGNSCPGFVTKPNNTNDMINCYHCMFETYVGSGITSHWVTYCRMRTREDDPYNEKIGTSRVLGPDGRYWDKNGQGWLK